MKLKVGCSINLVGCERTIVIDITDDLTEKEIEDVARDAAFELFDWWYEKEE